MTAGYDQRGQREIQVARLSPENYKKYRRARGAAIASGLIALFSFWIMFGLFALLSQFMWQGYSKGPLRLRYGVYLTCAIVFGLVSLLSYPILVAIANGSEMGLYQLAPVGFFMAIVSFIFSMILTTKAKDLRETIYWSRISSEEKWVS